MITPEQFIAESRYWLGTPWQHGQACLGVGCDCIGFIAAVAVSLGLPEGPAFLHDARYIGYGRTPNPEILLEACDKYMDRVTVASQMGLANVLVLRMAGQPHHFALVSALNPAYMIHSLVNHVVSENRIDERWMGRLMRTYSLRGVG